MGVINTLGIISVSSKGIESHQSSPRHDCSAGLFSLSFFLFHCAWVLIFLFCVKKAGELKWVCKLHSCCAWAR